MAAAVPAREGRFRVYPIAHVDQGLELLTGMNAGERDADGSCPENTFNRLVQDRLRELARKRRAFQESARAGETEDGA